jgi:hypothetical protein
MPPAAGPGGHAAERAGSVDRAETVVEGVVMAARASQQTTRRRGMRIRRASGDTPT